MERVERELDRQARQMGERTEELDTEINSVRQEFQRKRNDPNTPGLPPEPEAEREQTPESSPDRDEQPPDSDAAS